jgi:hypothetical protein
VGATDLEVEHSSAHRTEPAFGFQFVVRLQVSRCTQRQMQLLVEVFAQLAVALPHLVGDVLSDERPGLIKEFLILGGKSDR